MRRNWLGIARLALGGLAVVIATGCPDSDPLETGNFSLRFETTTTNDADWACVLMDFVRLEARPQDGICSNTGDPCFNDIDCGGATCAGALAKDSLAAGAIEMVIEPGIQKANFSSQGQPCTELVGDTESGGDFPLQILSDGLYRLTTLQVNRPALVDAQGNVIDCFSFTDNLADGASYPSLNSSMLFRVGENEPNLMRFQIDAEALQQALAGDCVTDIKNNIDQILTID